MGDDQPAPHAMSEYERQRLEHIRRNNEYLASLGLSLSSGSESTSMAQSTSAKSGNAPNHTVSLQLPARKRVKKEQKKALLQAPTRRSSRLTGQRPQYTGELIDRFFDGGESLSNSTTKRQQGKQSRSIVVKAEKVERGEQSLEHLASTLDLSREWLAASRKALLQVGSEVSNAKSRTGEAATNAWRQEAVRRWGQAVPKGSTKGGIDWEM